MTQATRPSIIPRMFRVPTTIFPFTGATASAGTCIGITPPVVGIEAALPSHAPPPLIQIAKPLRLPAPAALAVALPQEPLQVGGDVQAARIITRVIPTYPAMAKQARISGTVRLLGVIAPDGTIQKLQVVSGHPLLARAALDAVRQWVYRPTLLNGEPVEVIAPIDVIFTPAMTVFISCPPEIASQAPAKGHGAVAWPPFVSAALGRFACHGGLHAAHLGQPKKLGPGVSDRTMV